jgi:GntR family transcriptional regulator/MocR family aminotransferase
MKIAVSPSNGRIVPSSSAALSISRSDVVPTAISRAPDARAAFVMPTRQAWLATSTSRARRAELLRWADEARAWVVEDDYGGEFYFGGRPLPALQGDDRSGRVVYVGTFSKVMFPSLRLGYLVVPEGLVDAFGAARHASDLQSPYLEQAAMAEFMAGGHYERHVRRMRQAYHERQALLVELAREKLRGWLDVPPVEGGMACVGWLPPHLSDAAVAQEALADGVDVVPLSRFVVEHPQPPALLLGFSGVSTDEIRAGVERLARTFERLEHNQHGGVGDA